MNDEHFFYGKPHGTNEKKKKIKNVSVVVGVRALPLR